MRTTLKATGLPDLIDAFHEALGCHSNPERFNWSHPLVYKAACLTGFSSLRLEQPKDSFEIFKRHYLELKQSLFKKLESPGNDPLALIDKLSRELELDPALLYYLTKPEGSYMRQFMRQKSIGNLIQMNRYEKLPA